MLWFPVVTYAGYACIFRLRLIFSPRKLRRGAYIAQQNENYGEGQQHLGIGFYDTKIRLFVTTGFNKC